MILDIPFVKNRGAQCGQANAIAVIKYFYPEKKMTFKQINIIIRAKPNKYTWPFQIAIALNHFGVKAKAFSKRNYDIGQKGIRGLKKAFGKDFDYIFNKWIDYPMYEWAVKIAKRKRLFEVKATPFPKIERLFKKGFVVMPVIDWNVLKGIKNKPYEGHFVIITGIEKNNVYINDPDNGKNLKYPKKRFIKAYSTPALDDDLCVAYGKK
jgi:hypothetical protein